MKLKEKFLFSILPLLALANIAQAQGVNNSFFQGLGGLFGAGTNSPAASSNIGQLIVNIISMMLLVVASLAVIYFLVGGYKYVIARGNEESAEEAKHTMTAAIWGLVYTIMAFAFMRIIAQLLLGSSTQQGI